MKMKNNNHDQKTFQRTEEEGERGDKRKKEQEKEAIKKGEGKIKREMKSKGFSYKINQKKKLSFFIDKN